MVVTFPSLFCSNYSWEANAGSCRGFEHWSLVFTGWSFNALDWSGKQMLYRLTGGGWSSIISWSQRLRRGCSQRFSLSAAVRKTRDVGFQEWFSSVSSVNGCDCLTGTSVWSVLHHSLLGAWPVKPGCSAAAVGPLGYTGGAVKPSLPGFYLTS